MAHYQVTWVIDVDADSPVEAAKAARGAQYAGTSALVFECADDVGSVTTIDLEEHDGDSLG